MITPAVFIGLGAKGHEVINLMYKVTAVQACSNLGIFGFVRVFGSENNNVQNHTEVLDLLIESENSAKDIKRLWEDIGTRDCVRSRNDIRKGCEQYCIFADVTIAETTNDVVSLIEKLLVGEKGNRRAEVFLILRQSETEKSIRNEVGNTIRNLLKLIKGFGRVYLIDSMNTRGYSYKQNEQVEQIARMALVKFNTELVLSGSQEDQLISLDETSPLYTLGVAEINYPVERTFNDKLVEATRLLIQGIERSVRRIPDESAKSLARGFLEKHDLTTGYLKKGSWIEKIIDNDEIRHTQGSLRNEISVSSMDMRQKNLQDTHSALNNFHIFMCESRLDRIVRVLKGNRVRAINLLRNELKSEVDSLLSKDWNPESVRVFLREINSGILETIKTRPVRSHLTDNGVDETLKQNLDMRVSFGQLMSKIKNIPLAASIVSKSVLTGLAFTPFVYLVTIRMLTRAGFDSIPNWLKGLLLLLGFVLPTVIALLFGKLTLRRSLHLAEVQVNKCKEEMQSKYYSLYEKAIESCSADILSAVLSIVDEKNEDSKIELQSEDEICEWKLLKRYVNQRRELTGLVDQKKPDKKMSCTLLITDLIRSSLSSRYKKEANTDWDFEVQLLLERGFTSKWRDDSSQSMLSKIQDFVRPNLEYMLSRSIEDHISGSSFVVEDLKKMLDAADNVGSPMIRTMRGNEADPVSSWLACQNGSLNKTVAHFDAAGLMNRVGKVVEIPVNNSIYILKEQRINNVDSFIDSFFLEN